MERVETVNVPLKIQVHIPHTPWVPERVAHLQTMLEKLPEDTKLYTERVPNWVWSEMMWRRASEMSGVTHHLVLNDDVLLPANFMAMLTAMITARPDMVIGLETAHPAARTLAIKGQKWCTTSDGLIGVGYVLPHSDMVSLVEWRDTMLVTGATQRISEDTLIDVWAMSTWRLIWHPVPTIIDHDTELVSTYGNEHHAYRRPSVTWKDGDVCGWTDEDLTDPAFWHSTITPHLGQFYESVPYLCKMAVKNWDETKHKLASDDKCPPDLARFFR